MVKESEVEAEEVLVAEVEFESAAATAPTRERAARRRTVDQRERAAANMSGMMEEGKGKATKRLRRGSGREDKPCPRSSEGFHGRTRTGGWI